MVSVIGGFRRRKGMFPKFIKRLHSEDVIVRRNAASSLALIGPDAVDAVPDLIEALDDRDKETRRSAAWAPAHIGPGAMEAAPALIENLSDSDEHVRGFAAMALGVIGPEPGVVDALIPILNGLAYMGADAEAALPKLEEMSAHTDERSHEHRSIMEAIREIRIGVFNRENGSE